MSTRDKLIISCSFLGESFRGIPRVASEICRRIKKEYNEEVIFVAPPVLNKDDRIYNIFQELKPIQIGRTQAHYFWEQIDLPLWLRKNYSQSYLLTFYSAAPLMRISQSIPFVHDLMYKEVPYDFTHKYRIVFGLWSDITIKRSPLIFVPSQFTKQNIINTFNIKPDKIKVVYEGVSSMFSYDESVQKENYILAVSSLNKRKNYERLIAAYKLLRDKDPNLKLYIIGEIPNTVSKYKTKNMLKENGVVYIGPVDDRSLVDYYRRAKILVHVSLFEGFGLTPLEAMACGTPVVVSNTTSLPEVVGDTGLYVAPYSIDDIYDKIKMLLTDKDLYEKLQRRGLERAASFRWEKAADSIMESLMRLQWERK